MIVFFAYKISNVDVFLFQYISHIPGINIFFLKSDFTGHTTLKGWQVHLLKSLPLSKNIYKIILNRIKWLYQIHKRIRNSVSYFSVNDDRVTVHNVLVYNHNSSIQTITTGSMSCVHLYFGRCPIFSERKIQEIVPSITSYTIITEIFRFYLQGACFQTLD